MIDQYPHIMTVSAVITGSTRDANGDWVQGTVNPNLVEVKCRYETKDGNGYVSNESGQQIAYDGIVYMPLPVETIAIGSKVTITDNGVTTAAGTVKHFRKGQLNARLWI